MNLRRTGTLLGLCLVAISAFSHPMGNFSISHYARLVFGPEKIDLLYLIDMAEIPAFQEKPLLDLNGNGTIEESEQNAYLSRKVKELSEGLVVWLNGTRYPLKSVSQQLELLSGGLNLPTLRIYLKYEIPLRAGQLKDVNVLEYKDTNFSGRVGWKEIVVQGEGIQESSAPGIDKSQQLTHYPEDPAIRPPADLEARVRFRRIPTTANAAPPSRLISVPTWTVLLVILGGGVFLAWRRFSGSRPV